MEPVTTVVAAAIIAGIIQVGKVAGLPDKLAGLTAIALGIAGGVIGAVDGGWLAGLIAALTAVGAYSGVKNTAEAGRSL